MRARRHSAVCLVRGRIDAQLVAVSVKIARHGEVQEWFNWLVSKTSVRFGRTEGSNPSLSAMSELTPAPLTRRPRITPRSNRSLLLFEALLPARQPGLVYNMVMQDSIFTKIVKGEVPAHKVYEDDLVLAFLDIHPVQPGHMLVIPKKQVEFVWDLPDDDYEAVMSAAKKVALRLRTVLGPKYVGERIVGIDVPHAHVQLIPFNTVDEFGTPQDMESEPDHAALAAMADKLRIVE